MFFRDLIGHRAQLDQLRRMVGSGRMPHAILFSGTRGVGKAAMAHAVVGACLCEDAGRAQRLDACGECRACRALAHANHPDFELLQRESGKRDIGIPQMRELLQSLHRKPHWARGRVAIVDDAHRLTAEAQNAFLKTLEEPPDGALLVLVTSLAERVLPTVRSRCTQIRFGPLDAADLERFRQQRADLEQGVPLSLAAGSPGALVRLAQPDAAQAREIVLRFAEDPWSASPYAFAADLLAQVSSGSEADDDDARERRRDTLVLFVRLLAFAVRDLGLLALGLQGAALIHSDREAGLSATAARLDADDLFLAAEACESAVADLFRNVDPPLVLEELAAAVRRSCRCVPA